MSTGSLLNPYSVSYDRSYFWETILHKTLPVAPKVDKPKKSKIAK